jgi:hypothetical protein
MVDDERTGELDQALVVLGVLLVADAEFAEAIMPAVCALDDPAPRRVAAGLGGRGSGPFPAASLAGRMQPIAARLGRLIGVREVEALISAQVLGVPGGRGGARDHDAVQGGFRPLHVGAIGGAEHHAQRCPPPVAQDVPFGAQLAAIGRVGPCRGSAEGGEGTVALSAACQLQPIRCAAS